MHIGIPSQVAALSSSMLLLALLSVACTGTPSPILTSTPIETTFDSLTPTSTLRRLCGYHLTLPPKTVTVAKRVLRVN